MYNTFFKKLLPLVLIFFASCSSYKKIPYFKDLNRESAVREDIKNFSPFTVQPGDILGIVVSSVNPEAAEVFNTSLNRINGNNSDLNNNPVVGYLIDQKGEIQFPLLGAVKVAGLTTSEINEKIKPKLLSYLKEPTINTRILNFKVSVMGDVKRPDVYTVQNERITVTEALSLAGDLNITAVRKNVLLVRELLGKREYVSLDLTSKKIFDSPYYYLKNNDVIYVQPGKNRLASEDTSAYRAATLSISVLSIIALILTRSF